MQGQQRVYRVRSTLEFLSQLTLLEIACAMPATAEAKTPTARLAKQANSKAYLMISALPAARARMLLEVQQGALCVRPILTVLMRVALYWIACAIPAILASIREFASKNRQVRRIIK